MTYSSTSHNMATIKRRSQEKLDSYLELYCTPFSEEEETAVDNQVLQGTIDALPKEVDFTYDELWEQVEAVRDEDEWPMPMWLWAALIYGTKASKVVTENEELGNRVAKFNRIFADKLDKLIQEQKLVYGAWLIGPYFLIRENGPRLYHLKDLTKTPAEVLRFFGLQGEGQASDVVLITSKLAGHMNGFITSGEERRAEQLQVRRSSRLEDVRARSRLDLPKGTERPDTIELLEKMHKTLLRHKEESASLLKTHLYLVDRAYKRGGDSPTFTVAMDELLKAKGYIRRADGGFQANTYREEWGRIAALAGCWLELQRVREKNKRGREETLIDETPYWEVRARRRLEEGEALGLEPVLLEDPNAPIIKAVVIQPGLWWNFSDRGTMNYHLPYEVLALPTDGKGNETQRIAVQLAATLALWVRSSQQQHAGGECAYSVGALLEASGVKTRLEFEGERIDSVKRLRKYLAGTPDEPDGALHHLTSLGAFDIRIRDEDEFWAAGRGWQTRFWESQLTVKIPNLGIKKRGRGRAGKRVKRLR